MLTVNRLKGDNESQRTPLPPWIRKGQKWLATLYAFRKWVDRSIWCAGQSEPEISRWSLLNNMAVVPVESYRLISISVMSMKAVLRALFCRISVGGCSLKRHEAFYMSVRVIPAMIWYPIPGILWQPSPELMVYLYFTPAMNSVCACSLFWAVRFCRLLSSLFWVTVSSFTLPLTRRWIVGCSGLLRLRRCHLAFTFCIRILSAFIFSLRILMAWG